MRTAGSVEQGAWCVVGKEQGVVWLLPFLKSIFAWSFVLSSCNFVKQCF
jgi:hypothetical protein